MLDCSGKYLRVHGNGVLQGRLPVGLVGQVFAFGDVEITMRAIRRLAAAAVPVALLSGSGKFVGRVTGSGPKFTSLRRKQYELADNAPTSLQIVQALVKVKLASGRQLLLRQARNHPQLSLSQACRELAAAIREARAYVPHQPRL